MNPLWAVLLVLGLFLVVLRLRGKNRRKLKGSVYSRRISGFQVVANLQPDIPSACLFDHGIQFGKGFRRKQGPQLPHGPDCHCVTVPFSFTSNEVFNGALRSFSEKGFESSHLSGKVAGKLVERLKRAENPSSPRDWEAYLAAVAPDDLGEAGAVRRFLEARFTYLQGQLSLPEGEGASP